MIKFYKTPRILTLISVLVLITSAVMGQTVIHNEDFESAGGYTTSVAEFSDGFNDYFIRTDGSDINSSGIDYLEADGSFFTAMDTDGDGNPSSGLTLTFSGIDISNFTNLSFSGFFAEDQASDGNEDWDADGRVLVEYQIDAGGFQNLFAIEAELGTNTVPRVDTDFDGIGDGTEITPTFTEFTSAISGTGTTLELRITIDFLNAGDEDIAFDNIKITGNSTSDVAPPIFESSTPSISNITNTTGDLLVDLDEGGTAYYIVEASPSTSPSISQIMAGNNGMDAAAFISNTVVVPDETTHSFTEVLSGLTTSTEYIVHVVAQDFAATPNVTVEANSVTFTAQDATPPTLNGAATSTESFSNSIVLTMSEPVTVSSEAGFSVTIGGVAATVTGIAGTGTDELTLTITENIWKNSGAVLVSYDDTAGDVSDGINDLATFSDQAVTNNATTSLVADIAAARALSSGESVKISGEVIVTYVTGNSRDQIFIQDANAGILIDDDTPIISTSYAAGDGITGFQGTLGGFGGVTQIVPDLDPGVASTTNNSIDMLAVTIADFNAAVDTYESRLILIQGVTFSNANGTLTFTEPTSDYSEIAVGANTTTFDADSFLEIDYSSDVIPYGRQDLIVLARENFGLPTVTARSASDIQDNYAPLFSVAPATSSATSSSFDVTFQSDEPGTAYYVVDQNVSAPDVPTIMAGTSMAYTDVASDVTISIGSLLGATQYYVHMVLVDDEAVANAQTASVTVTATTSNNDGDSDITANGGATSNIDYSAYQEASGLSPGNSASLFTFNINDKGTADAVSTTLTDISFDIVNHENLRTVALFVEGNTTTVAEMDVAGNIATNTLAFSGLTLEATSGNSLTVTVRATFLDVVDDEEQIQLTVSNATADGAGSSFGTADAGGAASDVSTSDLNAIVVTATAFELTAPTSSDTDSDFTVSATAVDALGNTDVAARNVTLSRNAGSGTTSSTIGLGPVAMTNGVYEWTDVRHDTQETITLDVTDGSITTTSASIDIVSITSGVFFSEYIEGSSSNKYVEIYNGSGAPLDLSNFSVKQSNNGAGFDNHATAPAAYSITLSGTLAPRDVYIIYNGSANATIMSEGDLALSFGDNPGDRVASYNGDDAMGLFENDVLIDLIGDPAVDPGSGWDVAGTTTATANHTLVRKSSIMAGNTTALGSFGVDAGSSEWIVSAQDDVSNIGFHTLDGVASPSMTITTTLSDFGSVDNASVSASQSFTVSGSDLISDVTVTAPDNFEVSLDDVTFSASVDLSQSSGTLSTTTVHVRFAPTTGVNGAKMGDIVVGTSGAASETIAVSGTESGNVVVTSGVFITELADPNNNSGLRFIELYNSSDAAVDFTEGSGWRIDKYVNAGSSATQTLSLSGTIASKGFYIIATGAADTDFETAYGVVPDQFDGSNDFVAGSNGDDNLELYNGSDLLIDQFGVPGEDGTNTNHEFEDGRAERVATVGVGNALWDVAEWNIDNDGSTFPGNGTRDAPGDFDPGAWIGTGGPLITADITSFSGDFGAIDDGSVSASSAFIVSGSALTADIAIVAPTGFTISLDNTTFVSSLTLTHSVGEVAATTISARFEPSAVQAFSGDISITSDGATPRSVSVSGTGLSASTLFFEGFSTCPSTTMVTFSAASDADWECTTSGNSGNAASIGGFGADVASDDWLITPAIDLSSATNATLSFYSWTNFTDSAYPTIAVMASTDYSGSGDPSLATWVPLSALLAAEDSETWTSSGDIDMQTYVGGSVYIAYQYTSTGTGSGQVADWAIDDILVEDRSSTPVPDFTVTASLTDFGSVNSGSVSVSQSFTVEGSDLTANISVTAPNNFEVSLDNTTFSASVDLTQSSGTLASTTVHVRFAPASGVNGAISGDLVLSTTGANNQTIAVSGTEAGNVAIENDLFFSEYFEGSSSNKYLEIYNATGSAVDLSGYTVKQANNGVGFDNHATDPDAYNITLSGTLDAGDVYIIYNGSSAIASIISEGDLALSFGDNPGDRVASYNGDDAMGLFKGNVLIDLIGDPSNDPGASWDVAGTVGGSANHTLVRKASIMTGNINSLGSFGTNETDSEWIVLEQDNVSNIGFHTIDGVASPAMTVTASITDFGSVNSGSVSTSQNFTVEGTNLSADVTVTAPANFEVSLDDVTFSASVDITQASGTLATTTVHVRFAPSTGINGAKSGDVVISTSGVGNQTIAVTGTESGNVAPESGVFITELADPNNNAGLRYIELYNSTDATVDFTEGSGWRIDKYTNNSATVSQTLALTGSIASKGFYIIATGAEDTDFETAYGIAPDLFDGADNDVAGSNGDDNLELYNGSDALVDQFGVPGEDGTGTNHEFEDGRAERKATIVAGNPQWDVAEWNIDNDGSAFPGNGTRDAPNDFDPKAWIGTGGPLISLDISSFSGDFGGIDEGTMSASSSFTVSGSGLTADIGITAPAAFSISLDNTTFTSSMTLTQSGGDVASTTIHVRFEPSAVQAYSGEITLTSAGANDKIVAVSGTGLSTSALFFEGFSTCPSSSMITFSVASNADWDCTVNGNTGNAAYIGGFAADAPSDDWLITPSIDLSNATNATLSFYSWTNFSDAVYPPISLMASIDYTGSGNPNSATWTDLSALFAAEDSETWTVSGDIDLQTYVGAPVYLAWQYTSTGTGGGQVADWSIDDILVEDRSAVPNPSITVTGTIEDFGTVNNGSVSTSQNFMVEGANLTADISVTAPSNFEISLDNTTFSASLNLAQASGTVASTTIHVRFAPASGINGALTGSITLSTDMANDETIAVSGTEEGNVVIQGDLFFSEYIEPNGGNEKAIEIYNGTGAAVDLSSYTVKASNNGVGFDNHPDFPDAYNVTLSGTLADGDVYVIYNGAATDATILAEGDLGLSFGDNAGDRVASYNGNDAIGLFKNDVLIDLIGDPTDNPGSGWAVAGIANATQNRTLVRKESITTGNITPLGSFGTDAGNSEWNVLDENVFTNLGSHTVSTPVDPGFTLNTDNFTSDFGTVVSGNVSATSSYVVNAAQLTEDLVVTIPAGFEAALDDAFQGITGDSSLPLSIPIDNGSLDNVTVYVRFAPDASGTFSGNLVHSTAGYDAENVAVSGEGSEIAGIHDLATYNISVYPNPADRELNIDIPDTFGKGHISLINLDGAIVTKGVISPLNKVDTNKLRSGVYILQITNENVVLNHRVILR